MNEYVIYVLVAILGVVTGIIINKVANTGKGYPISQIVTSTKTEEEYHADKWRLDKDNIPWLRIWNQHIGHYEWFPIWHFKNPFLVMYAIDNSWAMSNMYKLMSIPKQAEELTKTSKK